MTSILNLLLAAAAAFCLLAGCGGGFGADNDEAKDMGPAIFGPDSSRR